RLDERAHRGQRDGRPTERPSTESGDVARERAGARDGPATARNGRRTAARTGIALLQRWTREPVHNDATHDGGHGSLGYRIHVHSTAAGGDRVRRGRLAAELAAHSRARLPWRWVAPPGAARRTRRAA